MSKLNDFKVHVVRDGKKLREFEILANSESAATSKPNWKCRKHSGWLYFPHKKDVKNYFKKKFETVKIID